MKHVTAKVLLTAFLLFCAPKIVPAACHVVTPGGSGSLSGADWNNAYAGLPSTLTRGDSYYLSDGTYGRWYLDVTAGSARTYIKKAVAADHCTDTGWDTATMGSSQAVTPRINFSTTGTSNNVTIDGNGTSPQPGCGSSPSTAAYVTPADCGIKIDNSGCTGSCSGPILMSIYQHAAVTGAVFRYMEWQGNGSNLQGNIQENNFLYAPQTTSSASWVVQHIYGHDTGCVWWHDYAFPTYVIEYSYFWKNWSDPTHCHGQLTYDHDSQNSIFRYNIVRDIEGTAVFTWDDGSATANFWCYGNIFYYTNPTAPGGQTGTSNATWTAGNPGSSCTNCYILNNTLVNMNYTVGFLANGSAHSVITAEDNLIYQATTNPGGGTGAPAGVAWHGGAGGTVTATLNSNTCIYSGDCGGGTNDVVVTGQTPVPFVNWTANTNETVNFNLVAENADWSAGLNLGTGIPSGGLYPCTEGVNCVDTDMLGHMRGANGSWDRGAFQFGGGTPPPAPPTGLTIILVK